MKNKVLGIVVILLIILICVRYYYVNKYYSRKYMDTYNKYYDFDVDSKIDDVSIRGVGTELVYAIEGEIDWNNLPLTDKFRKKYDNGMNIMPERQKYSKLEIGGDKDADGNSRIIIFAYHKPSFFDIMENNLKTTVYYYTYKVSNDKKLDDIELVKKEVTDSTTVENIE